MKTWDDDEKKRDKAMRDGQPNRNESMGRLFIFLAGIMIGNIIGFLGAALFFWNV